MKNLFWFLIAKAMKYLPSVFYFIKNNVLFIVHYYSSLYFIVLFSTSLYISLQTYI